MNKSCKYRYAKSARSRGIAIGVTLALIAASVASADTSVDHEWLDTVERAPLAAADFITEGMIPPNSLKGDSATRDMAWTNVDGWDYTATFRSTNGKLSMIEFSFAESDAASRDGGYKSVFGIAELGDPALNLVPINTEFPPGPGDVPIPGVPDNPEEPTLRPGAACPYAPGWDAKWILTWVPGYWKDNKNGTETWVDGHWKVTRWNIEVGPGSGFCD